MLALGTKAEELGRSFRGNVVLLIPLLLSARFGRILFSMSGEGLGQILLREDAL